MSIKEEDSASTAAASLSTMNESRRTMYCAKSASSWPTAVFAKSTNQVTRADQDEFEIMMLMQNSAPHPLQHCSHHRKRAGQQFKASHYHNILRTNPRCVCGEIMIISTSVCKIKPSHWRRPSRCCALRGEKQPTRDERAITDRDEAFPFCYLARRTEEAGSDVYCHSFVDRRALERGDT